MLRFPTLLLLLGLAACAAPIPTDTPAGDPAEFEAGGARMLAVERTQYVRGDTARLVLRNVTEETLGYNLCSSWWELRVGSEWRVIEPLRLCTRELRILEPGQTATWDEPITADWRAGEYRFGTTVYLGTTTATRVHSQTFTVAP